MHFEKNISTPDLDFTDYSLVCYEYSYRRPNRTRKALIGYICFRFGSCHIEYVMGLRRARPKSIERSSPPVGVTEDLYP